MLQFSIRNCSIAQLRAAGIDLPLQIEIALVGESGSMLVREHHSPLATVRLSIPQVEGAATGGGAA